MNFPSTFSPMYIGSMLVKNRLVMPAMDSGFGSADGMITDRAIGYYQKRAEGGYGMIILEITAVTDTAMGMPGEPRIYDDKYIPGLKKLTTAVHEGGARIICQLHHAGRETEPHMIDGKTPEGVSPVASPVSRITPREYSTAEVYQLIDDYIAAAVRAQKAGFDGVEVHSAHGYMGLQFISPRSNKRIDEFGGSLTGRTRFLKLVIEGIKKACGPDFVVIVRQSTTEGRIGGIDENESVVIAQMLESFGADALNVSAGTYAAWCVTVPPPDWPSGWNWAVTKRIKDAVKIPVMGAGRFADPELIEHSIGRGELDFVCTGRQSIADPSFPNKMMTGALDEIIPCISCTQRCMSFNDPSTLMEGETGSVSCMLNPMSSNIPELQIRKADVQKKIMVIGAGPAGLEAAQIAAQRGHQVTLYDKGPKNRAGGQFLIAAYPPFKQNLTRAIRYYMHMCEKHGVTMKFDTEVTEDLIAKESPDAVIIATGATPITPAIPGIEKAKPIQANDVLMGKYVVGDKVLVIGGGLVGVETAEYCEDYASKVSIVEMLPSLAPELYLTVRDSMMARFKRDGIDEHTGTKVIEFIEGGAICEKDGKQITLDGYDTIVMALGSKAYQPFKNPETLAGEVYVIGDAKKARDAMHAIYEAAMLALRI